MHIKRPKYFTNNGKFILIASIWHRVNQEIHNSAILLKIIEKDNPFALIIFLCFRISYVVLIRCVVTQIIIHKIKSEFPIKHF